jgi:hypothetical protein
LIIRELQIGAKPLQLSGHLLALFRGQIHDNTPL